MAKWDQARDSLPDLDWLVLARNDIQSLMLQLLQRWETISDERQRQHATAAAFSLWRAVFLLVKKAEANQSIDRVDSAAKAFLEKVIRTNAIAFSDDMHLRLWSSVYYVENATDRITRITGHQFGPRDWSPPARVREAWDEAFEQLAGFVAGTQAGTQSESQGESGMNQSA
jgi:hypothetical protein